LRRLTASPIADPKTVSAEHHDQGRSPAWADIVGSVVRVPLAKLWPARPPAGEVALLRSLREGDERAFAELVDRLGPSMLRVAGVYVSSRAVAEEVVQEAWLAVLTGLERFEGRSSLKTWIFHIVANKARTRAQREGRTVPFSSLGGDGGGGPSVDPERFTDEGGGKGHWVAPPQSLERVPEERLLVRETRERIAAAIAELPAAQRAVISLRDVEGLSAEEACGVLDVSEGNQRVLLHRARSKVRAALESYIAESAA
jgi:RNA polymerase sigma-70 factor (ECF subfamily)